MSGRLIVYFHGVPGSSAEIAHFQDMAQVHGVRLVAPDRFTLMPDLTGDDYFHALAKRVDELAAGEGVELVGFSMGAFVALRAVPFITTQIHRLHLISAAAPLESGEFFDHMAGKPVFKMAMRSEALLRRVARLQGWLARLAPGLLFRMLFASAQGEDAGLSRDADFRSMIGCVLKSSLGPGLAGYVRDIAEYVQPWSHTLAAVSCETQIWHGAQDNWSPFGMAEVLRALLPNAAPVEVLAGASHYSSLKRDRKSVV